MPWQRWRDREATVPHHFGRHTLANLTFCLGVERQGKIRMRVDVNEARCDHLAGGINDPLRWTSQATGECSDTPVAYGDIDHTTWRTTTIDNLGTTNDEVVHALSPPFLLRPCGPLLGVGLHRCGVGYEVRTATAAALYGSVQREGTQHRTDYCLCLPPSWSISFSSLALNVPIS